MSREPQNPLLTKSINSSYGTIEEYDSDDFSPQEQKKQLVSEEEKAVRNSICEYIKQNQFLNTKGFLRMLAILNPAALEDLDFLTQFSDAIAHRLIENVLSSTMPAEKQKHFKEQAGQQVLAYLEQPLNTVIVSSQAKTEVVVVSPETAGQISLKIDPNFAPKHVAMENDSYIKLGKQIIACRQFNPVEEKGSIDFAKSLAKLDLNLSTGAESVKYSSALYQAFSKGNLAEMEKNLRSLHNNTSWFFIPKTFREQFFAEMEKTCLQEFGQKDSKFTQAFHNVVTNQENNASSKALASQLKSHEKVQFLKKCYNQIIDPSEERQKNIKNVYREITPGLKFWDSAVDSVKSLFGSTPAQQPGKK